MYSATCPLLGAVQSYEKELKEANKVGEKMSKKNKVDKELTLQEVLRGVERGAVEFFGRNRRKTQFNQQMKTNIQ